MNRCRTIASSALLTAGVLASGVVLASPGDLDTTFDTDGRLTTAIAPGTENDTGYAMALQWDGKIVVAGTSTMGGSTIQDMTVVRYNPDGTLDTSFSGDGKATLDFYGGYDYADAVAIQLDGKILVAGSADNSAGGTHDDFALARYNLDGTLDTTFSGDGKVTTAASTGSQPDGIEEIAVQPDGKIVVVGYSSDPNVPMLARYNPSGSLDKTFSGDGLAPVPSALSVDDLQSVALTSSGKIIVAGSVNGGATGNDMAILRFTSRGRLDTTFGGGDGIATFALGTESDRAYAVVVASDGKIVAVGKRGSSVGTLGDVAVVRLLANGTPDGSFGFEGIVTTDIAGAGDVALAVALQWNGRIVVAGSADRTSTGVDATIVRYNTDGTLDRSFAPDGKVTVALAPAADTDQFWGVAVQWNGKIVGAGVADLSGNDFAAARFDATTTVRKSTSLSAAAILRRQVPTGASVTFTVATASKRVCSVVGGKLKAIKAGTCRATVAITPRGTTAVPRPKTTRVSVSFTVVD